eukprot:Transcript_18689.p1 GENE.Transcript_18689~~Transcript_18689.p1  ORF type:complete len:573 (+),score=285.53 Transcript_18689:161-1720(+)
MSKPRFQRMSQEQETVLGHNCALDIYSEPEATRKCSIIGTIGPKTKSVEMLTKLREAGLNIVRMNFSHGSYEYHGEVIANTRESVAQFPLNGRPVAIALDTKGPEIRTGVLVGEDVDLKKGATLTVRTNDDWKEKCDADNLYMDYKNITKVMKEGDQIFVDDGLIALKVNKISGEDMECEVVNSGKLGSRKGCNLPNIDVDLPALSEKDKKDLAFAVEQGCDMIFASFIRKASDVQEVRKCLVAANPETGKRIKIISKIENHEGVRNFDAILAETDGVMVARGDLGIEIPAQKVFIAQKMMIAKCNRAGKPIICATQMLESMTSNPRPTRAEVSDVANAVLDGADCVMLSGETAKGSYPLEAVTMMGEICKEAESAISYRHVSSDLLGAMSTPADTPASVASSAVTAANTGECAAIICLSTTGETARLISKFRPRCPIFVVSRDMMTCRQAHLHRGAYPIPYSKEVATPWEKDVNERIEYSINQGIANGFLSSGDSIVAVHGWKSGGHSTNTVRVLAVP